MLSFKILLILVSLKTFLENFQNLIEKKNFNLFNLTKTILITYVIVFYIKTYTSLFFLLLVLVFEFLLFLKFYDQKNNICFFLAVVYLNPFLFVLTSDKQKPYLFTLMEEINKEAAKLFMENVKKLPPKYPKTFNILFTVTGTILTVGGVMTLNDGFFNMFEITPIDKKIAENDAIISNFEKKKDLGFLIETSEKEEVGKCFDKKNRLIKEKFFFENKKWFK